MQFQDKVVLLSTRKLLGFTILEVLVAMVILAVGLVGMATLQLRALQNNQSAFMRTQAITVAKELLDDWQAQNAAGARLNSGTVNAACEQRQEAIAHLFPNILIGCTLSNNPLPASIRTSQMVEIRIAYDDAHWRDSNSVIQEQNRSVVYFTRVL